MSRALAVNLFSRAEPFLLFERGHHEEQLCEIILNLHQWRDSQETRKDRTSGVFVDSQFRARKICRCAARSLLSAFLYIKIVLVCLHVLVLCEYLILADKKLARELFVSLLK